MGLILLLDPFLHFLLDFHYRMGPTTLLDSLLLLPLDFHHGMGLIRCMAQCTQVCLLSQYPCLPSLKTSSTSYTFLWFLTETLLWDNALGRNSSHYQVPFGRHTNDIEFNDPAILAVGKGRMPGIGDSGLEMKNTHVFPAHLQTSNNDPRFQLQMQPNVQSHQNLRFTDHMHDAFNPMNDNYLASRFLQQSHGPVSPYAQMPQQPRNSQLTNGHLDGWSNLRQGNNNLMSDMSRMLYPSEVNNLHMLGSNDIYTRAFGM